MSRRCLNCARELPTLPWWRRLLFLEPPLHDPAGPEGPACWRLLCTRLGLDPDTPMPRVRR